MEREGERRGGKGGLKEEWAEGKTESLREKQLTAEIHMQTTPTQVRISSRSNRGLSFPRVKKGMVKEGKWRGNGVGGRKVKI